MSAATEALTLRQLNELVGATLRRTPGLQEVWVTAETGDVRVSGGHCYLELIEKDPDTGAPLARMRANIWASRYAWLSRKFLSATGSNFTSGIKVMLCVSLTFHAVYGLSANITDINPEYTLGDLLRRRNEMIRRLQAEGIIDLNRSLPWPAVPWRVAVISARGAAGYGDFINQLYGNRYRLRFRTELFPAVMQGQAAAASILEALDAIAARQDSFDCVVIIRGGGATDDLASFDNYDLAAHIAMFPLPVIVGIGHERDVTLLDYVAGMRVKTPTAAAEWLIGRGADALGALQATGNAILEAVSGRLALAHRRLEYAAGRLPLLTHAVLERAAMRTGRPARESLVRSVATLLSRHTERLGALDTLLRSLSPEATLRRGFSITRIDGRALSLCADAAPGTRITTVLADGEIHSTVNQ